MNGEDRRLATLLEYAPRPEVPEPELDSFTLLAARICDAPVALLTLVDAERQWFHSRVGTELPGTERSLALCQCVLEVQDRVVIPDLSETERFRHHPLVEGEPHLRFYAGEPLRAANGEVIGTLCVLDHEPRELTTGQLQSLRDLADGAMAVLESRRLATSATHAGRLAQDRRDREVELRRALVESLPLGYLEVDLTGTLRIANVEFCRMTGWLPDDLVGHHWPDLPVFAGNPSAASDLDQLLAGDLPQVQLTRSYTHADGGSVPVLIRTRLVRGPDGTPVGYRTYVTDDSAGESARSALLAARLDAELRKEYLDRLVDTLDVGVLGCDSSGRIILSNPAMIRLRSLPGQPWDPSAVRHADQLTAYDASGLRPLEQGQLPLQRALRGEVVQRQELVIRGAEGLQGASRRLVADARPVSTEDGRLLGAVASFTDPSLERERQQRLERSEEKFRRGFHGSPIGSALLDEARVVLEVNESLCALLGRTPGEIVGRPIDDLMPSQDVRVMRQQIAAALGSGLDHWTGERHYRKAEGDLVTARVSVVRLSAAGGPESFLLQVEDVTDQREAERLLAQAALHDGLTGLPNRALFTDRVEQALARAARTGRPVTVMFCDLDGFKGVNDGLGHAAGDEVLRVTAARIAGAVRSEDTVGRLGGDEFVILAEDCDTATADRLARRVRRALQPPVGLAGDELLVTASIGVAHHDPTEGPTTAESLLHDADTAMYRAKATGKNRHTVYDAALAAEATARTRTEHLLRRRLREQALEVHYQPVVELSSGRTVGVEALCRLRDDDGRFVRPDEFIDVAEQVGLIFELGDQVLRTAVAQAAAWNVPGSPHLHVAVNVSAKQASREDYAEHVLAVTQEAGLDPSCLILELTESVLVEATSQTVDQLTRLRDAGVGIAIDDFGTRYASLRYVQHLPLTQLKIDMSFTAGLPDVRADVAIVEAVAHLAAALGLTCVAEGIENEAQRSALTALGVHGQGYLLGRPCPAAQLALEVR